MDGAAADATGGGNRVFEGILEVRDNSCGEPQGTVALPSGGTAEHWRKWDARRGNRRERRNKQSDNGGIKLRIKIYGLFEF